MSPAERELDEIREIEAEIERVRELLRDDTDQPLAEHYISAWRSLLLRGRPPRPLLYPPPPPTVILE